MVRGLQIEDDHRNPDLWLVSMAVETIRRKISVKYALRQPNSYRGFTAKIRRLLDRHMLRRSNIARKPLCKIIFLPRFVVFY